MSVIFIVNSELASDFQIRVIPKSVLCSVVMKLLSGDIVNTYTTPLINTKSTGMNTVWTNNTVSLSARYRLILLSIMSKRNRGDQINYTVFPITRIKWSTFPVVIHYLVKSPGGNEIFHPWCRRIRKEWTNNWSPFYPGYPCRYLLKILLSPGL